MTAVPPILRSPMPGRAEACGPRFGMQDRPRQNVDLRFLEGRRLCCSYRWRSALIVLMLAGHAAGPAAAQDAAPRPIAELDDDIIVVPQGDLRYRFELKRQNTNVRSPAAWSKTTVRLEHFPTSGLSLVRLELPFPDESNGVLGEGFNPHMGDATFRLDWKGPRLRYWHLSPFVEWTFPTANPMSLGTGKYQIAPGIHTDVPLMQTKNNPLAEQWSWGVLAQQVMSVAGSPDTSRISYLKFEFALLQGWKERYTLTTTFKPTIDWVQNGKTGAVIEVEGGMRLSKNWKLSLLGGAGLWGVGISNTYNERTELTLGYEF